jgi:hypothetical protein
VDKILTQLETERKQARQYKYDWIDGDETVPPGWKLRVVEGKTRKTFFLSEDGCQFACRRSALQHLINTGAPDADVEAMRAKLCHEGWLDDPMLPPGWKVRKAEGSTNGMFDVNYYYLDKNGTMFHSTRSVVNFMKNSADYTDLDIGRIKVGMCILANPPPGVILTNCFSLVGRREVGGNTKKRENCVMYRKGRKRKDEENHKDKYRQTRRGKR